MLQCHPHPDDFSDKSRHLHCSYFMGLQRKQGVAATEGEQFDIRVAVDEFKHTVGMYNQWKPGMDISVSHVKRRNIPAFVFPGGVRPNRPSKVSWESKRSSELRIPGHGQAEKSQEGKVAALGGNDDRKRKRAEDSTDDLRNSKVFKSLPPSSREVHEDGNPVSIASSCSVKCDDTEVNSMSEQKSEKPDLNFSAEYPSVDKETNGSEKNNSQINPPLTATDKSSFNEAGKLDIEKITCGPYNAHQVFSGEPDELEDDLQYRNQIKDFGGNLKNGNLDSSNSESPVAAEPVFSQKENSSSTHIYSNGGLEELEVNILIYILLLENFQSFCNNNIIIDHSTSFF
jgi:poly(A) polymerase